MKNDNIKNLFIIGLVVIILSGAIFGAIYFKNKNKQDINTNINNEEIGKEQVNNAENKNENEPNNEENKIDVYEKYENVKWCGKETSIKDTMFFKIEENILTFEYNDKITSYEMKNGTPKSVTSYINGGIPMFFVLTTDGKVYELLQEGEDFSITGEQVIEGLKEYTIIDMTSSIDSVVRTPIYFLTEQGKLIDFSGYSYEELNLDFVSSFGNFYPLYFDKQGNICFRDYSYEDELVYITVKEDYNKTAIAKKVFWQFSTIHNNLADENISERYIVITETGSIVYVSDNGDIMIESSKVDFYEIKKEKDEEWNSYRYNVDITMQDGSKITLYDTQDYYYDVEKKEMVDFE